MTLKVEVGWTHVGFAPTSVAPTFDGPNDDVTDLVRVETNAVSVGYGRDQSTAMAPTVSGHGSLVLDNKDRRYSPLNPSSPLAGSVKPARPVRITRSVNSASGLGLYSDIFSDIYSDSDSAFTFVLFRGNTDDSPINPDVEAKTVTLSFVDGLAFFRGIKITTQLYSGIRTGEAIGLILDACGWPSSLRALDAGATFIPWWWEDNEDALTALENVLRSEGAPALLTMGVNGELIFMDRHHRLTNAASLTSQSTWTTGGAEPQMNVPFTYDDSWRNIINDGLVNIPVRTLQQVEAVWTADAVIALQGAEQRSIKVSVSDPFTNAITPAEGTDYTLQSGSVTVTLSRTSGASTVIQLTAGGGGAALEGLQLRAKPLTVAYSVQISETDTLSAADYGLRSFPGDLPWCNPYDAEAVLHTAIAYRGQPLPIVNASFLIADEERAGALLTRNISDLVTIAEPETTLNHEFFVENTGHDLSAEFDHTITFGTEMLSTGVTPAFMFDTAGHGFDDGKFSNGLDDPALMFRFDGVGSGHRFGDGLFAT